MPCLRRLSLFVLVLALGASAGCALTLDYDPPEIDGGLVAMDAGRVDVGPVQCAASDTCDDRLDCTVDQCVGGTCEHVSRCPTGTDCIERSGGVCRRACVGDGDCDDGIECTVDSCNPSDGHCEHTSSCDSGKPRCLDTGACVPTSCSTDDDCDDANECNGHERCVDGSCEAGAPPPPCDPSPIGQCGVLACDPRLGECVPTADQARCDDQVDCTNDACLAAGGDFTCSNVADDGNCDDGNQCTDDVCDANSGCAQTPVECNASAPCITSGTCDATSGACEYTYDCLPGQVCTPGGCRADACDTSTDCQSLVDPSGCSFQCVAGHCVPRTLCAEGTGQCGVVDAACAADATACHYHADAAACDDHDPATDDTCDPGSFTCQHTCIDAPGDCVTLTYDDVAQRCVPMLDHTFCEAHHATSGVGDCSRWVCAGSGAGVSTDGCARVAVNAACEDGYRCSNDVCTLLGDGSGRCQRTLLDAMCDDGATCTADHCDPANAPTQTGCTYEAHDDICAAVVPPLQCAEALCVGGSGAGPIIGGTTLPNGCALRFSSCDMTGHPGAYCNPLTGQCEAAASCASGMCDDGNPCNGHETCVGMRCIPGPPLDCGVNPMGCLLVCDPGIGCHLPGGPSTCLSL
ncbi:MAG: hypothetical protein U0234_14250 [Sandaracinus sp.]